MVHSRSPTGHVNWRQWLTFLGKMVSPSLFHRDLPEETGKRTEMRVQDGPRRENRRRLRVAVECTEGAEDFDVGDFSHQECGCRVGRSGLPDAPLVSFYQDAAGV